MMIKITSNPRPLICLKSEENSEEEEMPQNIDELDRGIHLTCRGHNASKSDIERKIKLRVHVGEVVIARSRHRPTSMSQPCHTHRLLIRQALTLLSSPCTL